MIVPQTPLELDGWLEFNAWRTGLKAQRFSTSNPSGGAARAVFYLDRRGRIMLPANNPYVPVTFRSDRERPNGRTAEWLAAAAGIVDEMLRRGTGNQLYLPPEVEDMRPWLWRGFKVGPRFTYYLDFPFDHSGIERTTRQVCDRATKLGYTVARVTDVGPVLECLQETADRAGFTLGLGDRELRTAHDILGEDRLRMSVCFTSTGAPASSAIVLHEPGTRAILWYYGTKSGERTDGAGHLLLRSVFDDAQTAGAAGMDLCGANMKSIATFKSQWGGRLVPNYAVRTYSIRAAARFTTEWIDWRRGKRRD